MEERLHRIKGPYTPPTNQQEYLEQEREEWKSKHQAMKDQLNSLEEECRKLQVAAGSTLPPQPASSSSLSSTSPAKPLVKDTTQRYTTSHLQPKSKLGGPFARYVGSGRSSPHSDVSSAHSTQSGRHRLSTRTLLQHRMSHSTSTPNKKLHLHDIQYKNAVSGARTNGLSSCFKPSFMYTSLQKEKSSDTMVTNQPDSLLKPDTVPGSVNSSAHSVSSLSSWGTINPHSELSLSRHFACEPTVDSTVSVHSPLSIASASDNDQPPSIELEGSRIKIRQLQKEITLLEQQLSDKTLSARHHVEELTSIRAELAQERSSLAILKQEIKDNAADKLEQTQMVHRKQCQEFQDQLERLAEDKQNLEGELDNTKSSLKASQVESSTLSERLTSLHLQMDQERKAINESMQLLRAEVKTGCERVTQLEHALEMCGRELDGHVSVVEENTHQYKSQIDKLEKQVESLTLDLALVQAELRHKTDHADNLQEDLIDAGIRKGDLEISLKQSQALYKSLCKAFEESQQEMQRMTDTEKRLRFELEQQHVGRTELERKLKQSELHQIESAEKKKETDMRVGRLENDLRTSETKVAKFREDINSFEAKAKQREDEMESMFTHMQQEMAKRAQQVLEMDGLLRSHQADTAARRLQLERTLAQRQGEVRARTQELEGAMLKLEESKEREDNLREEVATLKLTEERLVEKDKDISSKNLELSAVKRKLKDLGVISLGKQNEIADLHSELDTQNKREKDVFKQLKELKHRLVQLSSENQHLREQHVNQVEQLRSTHTSLLTSHKQQATAHHLQITQIVEQEQKRQEELSRCRAQVAALSAELLAERRVSEEARQQVAVSRAECIKLQAQVADLQKGPKELQSTELHSTGNSLPLHLQQT